MDLKDLTQEQMNQIAARLVDNKLLVDRAKADAWSKLIGWTEEEGDWKTNSYLQNHEPDSLQIVGDAPEVGIDIKASSAGELRIEAQWVGTFELKQRGVKSSTAFGFSYAEHEELVEMGDDLFYFEDVENYSEE